jgi:hypothetical protein
VTCHRDDDARNGRAEVLRLSPQEEIGMIPMLKKVLRIGVMAVIAYGIIYRFPC